MKNGTIVINSYNDSPSYLYQVNRFILEAKKFDIDLKVMKTSELKLTIESRVSSKINSFGDFIIFNDKDILIAKMLEIMGYKLFNSSLSIENCDNKFLTQLSLANNDIKMPLSIPSLLCYYDEPKIDKGYIDFIKENIKFPLVFKEDYGSVGKNVFLINDEKMLDFFLGKYKNKPFLLQEFIASSYGRDIRVICIGGKFVTAMLRVNKNNFQSNIGFGGQGYSFKASKKLIELSERIAKLLNLSFCGIDFLIGEKEDEYYLCEVNSNAFFKEIEKVSKKNIAFLYLEYINSVIY